MGSLNPLLIPQVGRSRIVSPNLQLRKPKVRVGRDLLSEARQLVLQLELELGTLTSQSCALFSASPWSLCLRCLLHLWPSLLGCCNVPSEEAPSSVYLQSPRVWYTQKRKIKACVRLHWLRLLGGDLKQPLPHPGAVAFSESACVGCRTLS